MGCICVYPSVYKSCDSLPLCPVLKPYLSYSRAPRFPVFDIIKDIVFDELLASSFSTPADCDIIIVCVDTQTYSPPVVR